MLDLAAELRKRREHSLYRTRRPLDGPQGPQVVVDGRPFVSFCSNDYLGLAGDPRVARALCEGAKRYGTGSGAAHLVTGHSRPHHALEQALAEFTGRPRALLFSTGYMANLGVIAALCGRTDTVFEDRLNHASLLDGGLLSRARLIRYRHADSNDLEARLAGAGGNKLVVTDGVFSMDGHMAPLPELAAACADHGAWLMVDDAHGLGVVGAAGGGTVEHYGLGLDQVPVLVGTLGKGLGTFGAFVAGSDDLIEYLIQAARTYIYTTALPPAVAHATLTALKLATNEAWRRDALMARVDRFRRGAAQLGLHVADAPGPIQPLLVGDSRRALELSQALYADGILVPAIRPPTVPAGTARLRITFSAAHSEAQVDQLLDALRACWA